ncbi:DUF4178 domain-containing protein [Sphingomonas jatrophae]|uniref:DUF4178 domain-containing protein n=1 Tax=Sphingomonas jatrophae TaxID=1166337 RepID=A0A1I6K062_9SPHN|nr:DUF4178 domain-containing protein [Sphingomonas jatrophae]SFR84632.1 protein of unknown function [Sphingomonas jatrophae]
MDAPACPNCGAPLAFRSAALPVKVCDFCRSTVIRRGPALELAGEAATVPEGVSPLQIGTTGTATGRPFELVGRVRWRWTDGAWSEWLMLFGDGSHGWLSESSSRWMMLPREGRAADVPDLVARMRGGAVKPGLRVMLDGSAYEVNDARIVTCLGSEGELPFAAPAGLEMFSVDLIGHDGRCASVQIEDIDKPAVYLGRYVALADLKPRNLRTIEGWPVPDFARA